MAVINMHEAKTQFSKLAKQARQGKTIVISNAGKPYVVLSAWTPEKRVKRKPGGWEGKVWIAPDFDETTPEILEMFYGNNDEDLT